MTHYARARAAPVPAALIAVLVAALGGCGAPDAGPRRTADPSAAGEPPRPSFLILDIDTLRADRLGSYGNPRATSPEIDAIAAEGTRFAWAFAQAPTTPPSQTSIFTSLYPSSHGVKTRHNRVPKAVHTLAEVLGAGGYRTAAFVDGGYMHRGFGLAQGFDHYDDKPGGLRRNGALALKWLRKTADKPFLLVVHTYDVHSPYLPPYPFRDLFVDDLAEPPTPDFEPTQSVLDEVRRSTWGHREPKLLPERDRQYTLALYDAGIRYADDWVGRFRRTLDELGIDDRTVIVVLSDHGEEFQEHGSVLHDKVYATVTRAPLIIRRPSGIGGGSNGGGESGGHGGGHVIEGQVEMIDVMPTLLELAGVPAPPELQGRSLVASLDGEEPESEPAFSESTFFKGQRAVSWDRRRLVHWIDKVESELYAYRDDPHEQNDLAAADGDGLADLRRWLRLWKRQVDAQPPPGRERSEMTEEVRRRLTALGYLQ